ncbi:hypothetical protein PS6_004732, partial [Mucor atramentarius]
MGGAVVSLWFDTICKSCSSALFISAGLLVLSICKSFWSSVDQAASTRWRSRALDAEPVVDCCSS